MKSFNKLDSIFLRYSIEKSDMPKKYTVEGVLYFGMGDFVTFTGSASTLSKAIDNMFKKSNKYIKSIRVKK